MRDTFPLYGKAGNLSRKTRQWGIKRFVFFAKYGKMIKYELFGGRIQ
jgi:hypothetical protein